MTNEELKLVDLKDQQYIELLKMQGKAYKKVLRSCKTYISDLKTREMIDQNLAVIDATIISEIEDIKNKIS